jgi:hypothetical protein
LQVKNDRMAELLHGRGRTGAASGHSKVRPAVDAAMLQATICEIAREVVVLKQDSVLKPSREDSNARQSPIARLQHQLQAI